MYCEAHTAKPSTAAIRGTFTWPSPVHKSSRYLTSRASSAFSRAISCISAPAGVCRCLCQCYTISPCLGRGSIGITIPENTEPLPVNTTALTFLSVEIWDSSTSNCLMRSWERALRFAGRLKVSTLKFGVGAETITAWVSSTTEDMFISATVLVYLKLQYLAVRG